MKRIIVGGGASGLVCAVQSAKQNIDTLVLEKNPRVGKKLSQTGNGRCNLCNADLDKKFFNDSEIVEEMLKIYTQSKIQEIFRELGIYTLCDASGRIYPVSENANSVVDCLRFACGDLGVKTQFDCIVKSFKKDGDKFVVETNNGTFSADQLVVANGSGAQNDGFVPLLNQWSTPIFPSLTPLATDKVEKSLDGCRAKCRVRLFADAKEVYAEDGEVLFRKYGLSGVCIFNCSAFVARAKVKGEKTKFSLSLDLLPTFDEKTLTDIVSARQTLPRARWFVGLLTNKLGEVLSLSNDVLTSVRLAKNYCFSVSDTLDFSQAQCVAGGVDASFLDERLSLPNGVRVCGEALNVDGLCGGYNLWFAFASGHFVGSH